MVLENNIYELLRKIDVEVDSDNIEFCLRPKRKEKQRKSHPKTFQEKEAG